MWWVPRAWDMSPLSPLASRPPGLFLRPGPFFASTLFVERGRRVLHCLINTCSVPFLPALLTQSLYHVTTLNYIFSDNRNERSTNMNFWEGFLPFKNIFDLQFLSHPSWRRNLPYFDNAEFFKESWYVVFYWELFKLDVVCWKLSKVMFVSGSLKLIRTSSRGLGGGWGCALCTPKRSLSLDFSLPNKTLEWPWDEHKPTPSHILHLRRNHFWQPTWLGFLTLYFTMLTLRNTITASSKYLEWRGQKRSLTPWNNRWDQAA